MEAVGKMDFSTKLLFTDLSSNIDAASVLGLDKTIVIKSSKLQQQLPSSILPEQNRDSNWRTYSNLLNCQSKGFCICK